MIDYLIASICVGSIACSNALNAFTIQTGIKPSVEIAQQKVNEIVVVKAKQTLPPMFLSVTSSGVYAYKVIQKKELTFSVPNFGICDGIKNTITLDSYIVKLEWKL